MTGAVVAAPGAVTPWFHCGKCGFKNHPRLSQDNTKCEQCGETNANKDAHDYNPGA